jgi:hypothetical protein
MTTEANRTTRRIVSAFVGFAVPMSVLVGATLAIERGLMSLRFGAVAIATRMVPLEIVRQHGAGTSIAAAAFALLVWSHKLDESAVKAGRPRALACAFFTALVGVSGVTALQLLSAFVALHIGFDVSWHQCAVAASGIQLEDLADLATAFVVDIGLLGVLLGFGLPYLSRTSWPLPVKVALVWVAAIAFRIVAAAALT